MFDTQLNPVVMADKTPLAKRLNTEMEFSPEGKMSIDKESLRDLLGEVLEEKFESHLQPLKNDINALKKTIEKQKETHESEISALKEENQSLSEKNASLQSHLERMESYQRKNNLRIDGIKEAHGEDLDVLFVNICNNYIVNGQLQFHNRTLERIHRLGPYKQGKTRTVVARFANYKDKMLVLQLRNKLKEHHKIYLSDDLPTAVEAKHQDLYPVYIALRSLQHQCTDGFVKSVKLISDKLWLNGTSYTTEDLGRLPENVSLDKLFNPSDKGITAFFRKFSKLSNHYPCIFVVKGERYSSMEKYLMSSKADFFGDRELVHKIAHEDNPVIIKKLGSRVRNYDRMAWQNEIERVLHEGLLAKFSQNIDLHSFLTSTGNTLLAEANQHDTTYGIGLSLQHKDLWDIQKWPGKNLLGKVLMEVRKVLQDKTLK